MGVQSDTFTMCTDNYDINSAMLKCFNKIAQALKRNLCA